jgi:hypothetical protein
VFFPSRTLEHKTGPASVPRMPGNIVCRDAMATCWALCILSFGARILQRDNAHRFDSLNPDSPTKDFNRLDSASTAHGEASQHVFLEASTAYPIRTSTAGPGSGGTTHARRAAGPKPGLLIAASQPW